MRGAFDTAGRRFVQRRPVWFSLKGKKNARLRTYGRTLAGEVIEQFGKFSCFVIIIIIRFLIHGVVCNESQEIKTWKTVTNVFSRFFIAIRMNRVLKDSRKDSRKNSCFYNILSDCRSYLPALISLKNIFFLFNCLI